MAIITTEILIRAPRERVFDLARSVSLHVRSTSRTQERAVGGVSEGLFGLGDEVTWEARHLGVRQRLSSRITRFDRPRSFRDSMVSGAFRRFDHDHIFEFKGDVTRMIDRFDFEAPFGPIGRLVERVFLTDYMRRFLEERAAVVRSVAETEDAWKDHLVPRASRKVMR